MASNIQRIISERVEVYEIRCLCAKFKNIYYLLRELGFMNGYSLWYLHGEKYPTLEIGQCSNQISAQPVVQCSNLETDASFDKVLSIVKDILPPGEKLPNSFYETMKMLKSLQLPSERIHVCRNQYMLFWGQFNDLDHCVVYPKNR
uniref:Uncharacterized protein n=1 Tax=Lactuca sativa TaxID=4236 RepID=A0A9R1V1X5_LACSA|nr:hypothetical protein LSAT_V11C700377530 [Lactuca sativa]